MITMYDSITPGNLPPGADAYLGYVDGAWPTYPVLRARFPHAHLLSMAVFASGDAEGCDVEHGDLTPAQVPAWVRRQIARGVHRPVVYASASVMAGPGGVVAVLSAHGIRSSQVRLLSAHYRWRPGAAARHICGPATCGQCPAMDGTQWRDDAPGANGTLIDESVLLDDFFGGTMAITDADAARIAKAVWTADGIIPGPDGNPANPWWEPQRAVGDLLVQVAALQASVAALAGALQAALPGTAP